MSSYRIGQIAARAGVGIDTVRYYERDGLLAPAARTASGYRLYGEADLKRLRFIRRAKALGFRLHEIRKLLELGASRGVARVKRLAQARLDEVDQRIAELQRIRSALREVISACPGHGRAEACPILGALSEEGWS